MQAVTFPGNGEVNRGGAVGSQAQLTNNFRRQRAYRSVAGLGVPASPGTRLSNVFKVLNLKAECELRVGIHAPDNMTVEGI
jgi:hypothetical protein